MENRKITERITVGVDNIVWHSAKFDPPKASGEYLAWSGNGGAFVKSYSAKYDGWGILSDGRRDFEDDNIEWWTPIIPPTVHE